MTEFRDNYSIMSYSDLEKQISKIIPDKNYKVIVKELTEEKAKRVRMQCALSDII